MRNQPPKIQYFSQLLKPLHLQISFRNHQLQSFQLSQKLPQSQILIIYHQSLESAVMQNCLTENQLDISFLIVRPNYNSRFFLWSNIEGHGHLRSSLNRSEVDEKVGWRDRFQQAIHSDFLASRKHYSSFLFYCISCHPERINSYQLPSISSCLRGREYE